MGVTIPDGHRADVETLWDFHQMHHELRPADVGIGLGSHDPTVPQVAVELYERGLFPYMVFTGANAPTTVDRYPRGEAVHYSEYAIEHGVPPDRILLEKRSTSTAENVMFTKELLDKHDRHPQTAIVMCRPYQQRRAYTICRMIWPELEVTCASTTLPLDEYVNAIGDVDRVINMMVGDTQRLDLDVASGFAKPSEIPVTVAETQARLIAAGYTNRLIGRATAQSGAAQSDRL